MSALLWKSLWRFLKKRGGEGAEGIVQLLRALSAEDQSLVPSIPWWLITVCNFSSRASSASSDLCRLLHACGTHMYTQAYSYTCGI